MFTACTAKGILGIKDRICIEVYEYSSLNESHTAFNPWNIDYYEINKSQLLIKKWVTTI